MKKVFLAVALVITSLGFAQEKISEGVITVKQTMSSTDEQVNMQLAMVGEVVTTTYFKENKSRSEMSSPMAGNTITVVDGDAGKMLMMMDNPMMGKKYSINDIKLDEEELKDVTVTPTNETKVVLGYTCKKYDVVMKKQGVEVKMVMYTTDKLSAKSQQTSSLGGKISGFPLYTEMKMNQMGAEIVVKMEATEIKKETVATAKFDMTPLEGYELAEVPKK